MTQTRPWFRKEPGGASERWQSVFSFFCKGRVSRLRARPKGFPIALWKPSGPMLAGAFAGQGSERLSAWKGRRASVPCGTGARQTVKKPLGGVGGAAAPPTFIRVSRLCRLRGLLILLAKSIHYKFGRPLVDRICFLEKVVSATFSTRRRAPVPCGTGARGVSQRVWWSGPFR